MKPLYLAMKDFMNHGESEIDFSKLTSATIIVGMEDGSQKASNGTGKTNIFNAIRYALFNSKISTAKEKVIRKYTNRCVVVFIFEASDGAIYKIERSRTKNTQAINFAKKNNNDWTDLSGRTNTQTDETILNTIGINEQTFENSSYLKQNDHKRRKFETLAAATPEERKSIIINMLQLSIWSKFEKRAKELRDSINSELEKRKALIASLGNPQQIIDEKKQYISELEIKISECQLLIDKCSQQISTLKEEKNILSSSLDNKYPELEKKLKNETRTSQSLVNDISNLKSRLAKLQNDNILINKQIQSKTDKVKETQDLLKQYESEKLEDISEADLNKVLNEISKLKAQIRDNKSLLTIIKKPIPKGEFCSECGTELNKNSIKELSDKKSIKAKDLQKLISSDEDVLAKLNLDKAHIENVISNNNKKLENINKTNLILSSLAPEINNLKNTLDNNISIISSLNEELLSKETKFKDANDNIKNLQKQLSEINQRDIENKIEHLNNTISNIERRIITDRKSLNSYMYEKGETQAILKLKEEALLSLEAYDKERKEYEKKLTLYKAVVSCFSSSGIPAMIIHSVLDSLQNETNRILEKLKPGIQLSFVINKEKDDGTITDTLNILYYINGVEEEFEDLSGGQQAAVVLAMKFATANISRKRCGSDIKLLLLDEVDQALDEQSVEYFYDIIKTLSKDMTILVITHNKELRNNFKSFILVSKNNGISHAEVKHV